jgi:hypothetical protein
MQNLAAERGFGVKGFGRDEEWYEKQFQAKLLGGFNRKDPVCSNCFVKVSKNGTCNCC